MNNDLKLSRHTVAVIVAYNSDLELVRQILLSLKEQCPVVIIDNGSAQALVNLLKNLVTGFCGAELLCLDENTGIAHAQNVAINHIINTYNTVTYVLLLDHDSIPDRHMVRSLEDVFNNLVKQQINVAAVGPVLYDPRDDKYLNFHKARFGIWGKIKPAGIDRENSVVEVDGLNSSGTLLSIAALREVGGFDDNLFIDHVETDWCFRARHSGLRLFATTRAILTHHMGDDVCYYWAFGRRRMPYRSPSRHYYLMRNSILLQKREYVPISWKLSNLLKIGFTIFYFGYYYKDRTKQRRQIYLGVTDGLKGVTGPANH